MPQPPPNLLPNHRQTLAALPYNMELLDQELREAGIDHRGITLFNGALFTSNEEGELIPLPAAANSVINRHDKTKKTRAQERQAADEKALTDLTLTHAAMLTELQAQAALVAGIANTTGTHTPLQLSTNQRVLANAYLRLSAHVERLITVQASVVRHLGVVEERP